MTFDVRENERKMSVYAGDQCAFISDARASQLERMGGCDRHTVY